MTEEWDPDEIVEFDGVPLRLCLVVLRVTHFPKHSRPPITVARDLGKEPRILGLPVIEKLARMTAFKTALREYRGHA